jgi:hypothetical protein
MIKFNYNSDVVQENLEEMLLGVSLSTYIEGIKWYWEAHNICQDLADIHNIPLEIVVGMLAALSPQKSWEHNLELVKEALDSRCDYIRHTKMMSGKATMIYNFTHLYKDRKGFIERMLGGPKIISFFNNILNPYDNTYVTIDTHHISICTGLTKLKTVTEKQYEFLRVETLKFAKKNKLLGNEAQAILWTHYKTNK